MSNVIGSSFFYTMLLFSVTLFLTQRKSPVLLSIIMPATLNTVARMKTTVMQVQKRKI
jgi:hypothetical protein